MYLLSAKGARLLKEQRGLDAISGNALKIGNPVHRACSNWYLISAIHAGRKVVTEHEIVTGRGPVRVLNGKSPDGVIIDEDEISWIECEHSQKSRGERHKSVLLVKHNLGGNKMREVSAGLYLARVIIVATNMAALRWMSASFQDALNRGELSEHQVYNVDACLLPISESLVPAERVEGNMYWEILKPADATD